MTEAAHQVLPMIEGSPHYLPQSVEALIVVAALVSISMLAIIFVLIKKRGTDLKVINLQFFINGGF
jgi:hypothetical protein